MSTFGNLTKIRELTTRVATKATVKVLRQLGIQAVAELGGLLYYDRAPISIFKNFSVAVGAGLRSDRVEWNYTVPVSRKTFVESAYVRVTNAAGTLNGSVRAAVGVAKKGDDPTVVGNYFVLLQQFLLSGQTVTTLSPSLGSFAMLQEGEILGGISTVNNNAVGTDVTIEGTAKATEFDA